MFSFQIAFLSSKIPTAFKCVFGCFDYIFSMFDAASKDYIQKTLLQNS